MAGDCDQEITDYRVIYRYERDYEGKNKGGLNHSNIK
jgi:hypothetical protein